MNVPKLRFKEFSGEWEEATLDSISEKINRKNKDSSIKNVISNSASRGLISQRAFFEKDIANKDNIDGYYVISKEDFVYNPRISNEAPYGPINIYKDNEDGIVSPLYTCFRIIKEKVSSRYIYYFFKSTSWYKYIHKNGDSGARHDRVSIKNATFFKLPVSLPTFSEQQKIAGFFENIDKKIQLQQQKIDLLQDQKKGYMQKIFKQELKFKDGDGKEDLKWENKPLGELCHISTGNKDTQNKKDDGKYPFFVRSQTVERIDTYSFDGEAILTAGDGVGVGKVFHYITGKFDYHQRVYSLSNFKNSDGKYIYYYFSMYFMKEAQKYNAKTSVDSVRREMITKMQIPIPCLKEQKKISSFLSSIDKLVEKEQQKLDLLKEQKKAFMQQMFI